MIKVYATKKSIDEAVTTSLDNLKINGVRDFSIVNDEIDNLIKVVETCEDLIDNKDEMSNEEFYSKFRLCAYEDPKSFEQEDFEGILHTAGVDPSTVDMRKLSVTDFISEDGKYYSSYLDYLKRNASDKLLKSLYCTHLLHIHHEIDRHLNINYVIADDSEIEEFLVDCKKDIDSNKGFQKRLIRLTNINNKNLGFY